MSCNIHVADKGTQIIGTFKDCNSVVLDISLATTKVINFELPAAASSFDRAGSFVTNGTDGKLKYTLVTGDIGVAGYWHLQGRVVFADGREFRSDRVRVRVYGNNVAPA